MSESKLALIVDLDGTLASVKHRQHHVEKDRSADKNWMAFFDEMVWDAPIIEVFDFVEGFFKRGWHIIMVSGRPEQYRAITETWLAKTDYEWANFIPHLFMREREDYREDSIVKEELYYKHIKPHWDITLVVDDRPAVVQMWRDNDLPVYQVQDPGLEPLEGKP